MSRNGSECPEGVPIPQSGMTPLRLKGANVNESERQQLLKEKRHALAAARDAYDGAYARAFRATRSNDDLEVAGAKLAAAIESLAAVQPELTPPSAASIRIVRGTVARLAEAGERQ